MSDRKASGASQPRSEAEEIQRELHQIVASSPPAGPPASGHRPPVALPQPHLAGIALLLSGIWQGRSVASCIAASKDKPEIFGLSLAPAAIVEGYAVFTFVFALVLAGSIPHGTGG
jgi:F0F1-type ATP synthase membrane subunit c/vacuolar-type H+-ATPase subunit K